MFLRTVKDKAAKDPRGGIFTRTGARRLLARLDEKRPPRGGRLIEG
jgi:hypothetical protein